MLELFIVICVFSFLCGAISEMKNPQDPEKTKEDFKKAAVFLGVTTATCSRKLLKSKKHRW